MIDPILNPFPIIETDRLILREVKLSDAPAMHFMRSDPAILDFMDRDPDANLEVTEKFIEKSTEDRLANNGINWGISLKTDATLIGDVGIWRLDKAHHRGEIGYRLHTAHQGKGIMTEALSAVLDFGFQQIGLHSIEANVNPKNEKSSKLLKRLGFRKEALFTENYFYNGQFLDSEIYSLLENWR